MKYIWIIFIIIGIEEIIFKKIYDNKKEFAIYCVLLIISVGITFLYYSKEYSESLLGILNDKIDLERFVWIK